MRLEVNNLIYRYHKKALPVLEEISFSMTNEERVGVAAPSGRGKTTLCKLIGGYLVPEQGEILLDGKSVMEYRGYCPIQMIWQQPELAVNPRLRMKEVLAEGDQIAERVIHGMGIEEDWLERFSPGLSGGELQRFLLSRALGQRTRFLLMDEITAMLDLITQSQIWNFLLQEVQERKIGLLVVSHSRPLLNQVCTRMLSVF